MTLGVDSRRETALVFM